MIGGFHGCENLNLISVEGFPQTNTKNLRSLFQGCTSLTTINKVKYWDVSNVPSLSNMLSGATNFDQDLSGWNFNVNVVMENFMSSENYSPNYYDSLLKRLSECVIDKGRTQANRHFGMGGCKFTAQGKTYRDQLIFDGWIITDGGQI